MMKQKTIIKLKKTFRVDHDKDKYQDFKEVFVINNFKPKLMGPAQNDNIDHVAAAGETNNGITTNRENEMKYITTEYFAKATLLGCSPCYREWLSKRTIKKLVVIKKQLAI